MRKLLFNVALRSWISARVYGIDIVASVESDLGDRFNKFLKGLVAGDKISLGIDLDDGTGIVPNGNTDQTFGSRAAGFISCCGEALSPEPIDRRFQIAVIRGQRLFAIHNAGGGLLAQFLH